MILCQSHGMDLMRCGHSRGRRRRRKRIRRRLTGSLDLDQVRSFLAAAGAHDGVRVARP